ncbi:MAG: NAD-dependent deacylase [Myxococcota bacterium]
MPIEIDAETLSAMRSAAERGVTILTGAGLSAESGIATFRDSGGLWENHSLDEVATPEGWAKDSKLVTRFYNARRAQLHDVEPNPGHFALARLEKRLGARLWLITQNVDDLLERAGATRVFHMHGELRKVRCTRCRAVHEWYDPVVLDQSTCPSCSAKSLRPHIVWFGEVPFYLDDAIPEALESSGLFISVGTSGVVYPAAGLVSAAKELGAMTLEVNLEPSANAQMFDVQCSGRSGELLPELVGLLTGG